MPQKKKAKTVSQHGISPSALVLSSLTYKMDEALRVLYAIADQRGVSLEKEGDLTYSEGSFKDWLKQNKD